jgi:ketosteroid isomerase-like protein
MPDTNADVVRRGMDAFNRGDTNTMLALLHPDVDIFGSPDLANPGTYRGLDGFMQWLNQWMEAWEEFRNGVGDIEQLDDENVLVTVDAHGRGRGSGIEVDLRLVYLFTVREGSVVRLHLYADRQSALAAAGR